MDIQVITDLKRQGEMLDGLIQRLGQKEQLDEEDLRFYDVATKRIERSLKEIKNAIAEKISEPKGFK